MADNTLDNVRISLKNDTKSNWQTKNPTLLKGEIGIEFDPNATANTYTVKFKIGDGASTWSQLGYFGGEVTLPAPDGTSIVDDNNVWSIAGFSGASAGTFPIKRITSGTSSIEWIALPNNFGSIKIGNTTVAADIASDTLEIVAGDNVTITPDTTNDKITIAATDTTYESKAAASGGTDESLVTTGEKYTWNSKMSGSIKYGASMSLSINSTTYVVTAQLKDQNGNNLGTAQTIDLPLESVVVSGAYDSETKKVILTLQDGSTIDFSVADLVDGLQDEITSTNKLDADLVDDTTSTHKFVTAAQKTAIGTAIQGVKTGTVSLTPDGDKIVTIPIASTSALGVVKSSTADNKVTVGSDGTMTVNNLSTDKLKQGSNTLILDCGSATV